MQNQELFRELSDTEDALKRAITALIQASERYCATFPASVKEGLPSYADAKSNVSAAYYMYATALSYVLQSANGTLSALSPLVEKADKAMLPEVSHRCTELIQAFDHYSEEALSPYFEESQRLIHGAGDTIALSPLYQATRQLVRQSEDFLSKLS